MKISSKNIKELDYINRLKGKTESSRIRIGGKKYDVKFENDKLILTRRMPRSNLARFAVAAKDFFARGFTTESRATNYARYLNEGVSASGHENPPPSLAEIISPQQTDFLVPEKKGNQITSEEKSATCKNSHSEMNGYGHNNFEILTEAANLSKIIAPKKITTSIEDTNAETAQKLYDVMKNQDGKIGITMSSTQSNFKGYENNNLAAVLPNEFDGNQARILYELRNICIKNDQIGLLKRIYIVPFACDSNTSLQVTQKNIEYAKSFMQQPNSSLYVWGVPGIALAIGGGKHTREFPNSENYAKINSAILESKTSAVTKNQFSVEEINRWLFGGKTDSRFPKTKLRNRDQKKYLPKTRFSAVPMIEQGKGAGRLGIYEGGITDLHASGARASICTSNNGDLLTGCGFAVAKAVINSAGPGLQAQLYNEYGVPGVMQIPDYGKQDKYANSEGRGYALSCQPHDMSATHGLASIELLSVPMYDLKGLKNMYKEAFEHAKDMDYIAVPMAGITHPLLKGESALSAAVATDAAKEFIDENPDSKLKIVFVIFNNPTAVKNYKDKITS